MSETQEMTFSEVKSHNNKKDLYLVIHDKVYDATEFIDEHPGGEEVLIDVGGQDATEAFEDVGHSDEARTILDGLLKGTLKRQVLYPQSFLLSVSCHVSNLSLYPSLTPPTLSQPGDPEHPSTTPPGTVTQSSSADGTGMGVMFYALVLLGGGLAFGAYKYLQAKSAGEAGK
ncbi:MAG: hypothetical protein Q9222_006805 [Ikaeria aurantiellina]